MPIVKGYGPWPGTAADPDDIHPDIVKLLAERERTNRLRASADHLICIHEAAHAVIALYQREPLYSVEIHERGGATKQAEAAVPEATAIQRLQDIGPVSPEVVRHTLINFLAGAVAEHRLIGRSIGYSGDLRIAQSLLDTTDLNSERRHALVLSAMTEAERIVTLYWPCVESLANRLGNIRYMTGDQVRAYLRDTAMGRRLLGENLDEVMRERAAVEGCGNVSVGGKVIGRIEQSGDYYIAVTADGRRSRQFRTASDAHYALREAAARAAGIRWTSPVTVAA
jgi:hypothetical protein